jgi:hypothetical protein
MNFDLMWLWNGNWRLRTKLHLHVKHVICVYECYANYNEWNYKCIEFFQIRNFLGYDELSSKPYLCYDTYCNFRFSPKIVCRISRSSKGTVMVL